MKIAQVALLTRWTNLVTMRLNHIKEQEKHIQLHSND
jgi:hypothetical protein